MLQDKQAIASKCSGAEDAEEERETNNIVHHSSFIVHHSSCIHHSSRIMHRPLRKLAELSRNLTEPVSSVKRIKQKLAMFVFFCDSVRNIGFVATRWIDHT